MYAFILTIIGSCLITVLFIAGIFGVFAMTGEALKDMER